MKCKEKSLFYEVKEILVNINEITPEIMRVFYSYRGLY